MPTTIPNGQMKEFPQKISASHWEIAMEVDGGGK